MNPAATLTTALKLRPNVLRRDRVTDTLLTGLPALDALTGGFPRGSISEITGPECSGRTTLAHSLLAASTARQEICAYIDTSDSFDPISAAASGVALSQLVWIRCNQNAEHALKAADYLLHAGGFGVILLDLCQISPRVANRIPISYWYRFRLELENTPTILALLEKQPMAKSCAALMLDMRREKTIWTGPPGFQLLRESQIEAIPRKPVRSTTAHLKVEVLAKGALA